MRLSVPLSLAALSQLSSAFYPYTPLPDKHPSTPSTRDLHSEKRSPFYPYSPSTPEADHTSHSSPRSIQQARDGDSGGVRISLRRRPAKRQNKFNVLAADNPKQSNSAGVDQDGTDFSYFASFKFGASSKTFYLLLDSAASNTWVMSSDCSSSACGIHTTFGPSDSSTLKVSQNTFSVAYGTGSVKGVQGTDTVHLGGMSVPLTFGLAQSVSDEFLSYPMDGILGLGRPDTLSSDPTGVNAPSLLDALISQKVIHSKLFGLALWRSADGGNNNGEINFGAPDTSRYDGGLNYMSAITGTNGFWEIPIADAGVDGKKFGLTGRTAILDSGTSFVLMPQDDAAAIHQGIPNSSQNGESFTVPCDATAKVQIVFGSITYDISPKDYVGRASGSGCASNIVGRQVFGSKQWLVGDVFLKNVYAVFDYDQQRVGLGVNKASVSNAASSSSSVSNGAKATQSMLTPTPVPTTPITQASQSTSTSTTPALTTSSAVQSSKTYLTFTTAPSTTSTQTASQTQTPSRIGSVLTSSSGGSALAHPTGSGTYTGSGYQQPTAVLIPGSSSITTSVLGSGPAATTSPTTSTKTGAAPKDRTPVLEVALMALFAALF